MEGSHEELFGVRGATTTAQPFSIVTLRTRLLLGSVENVISKQRLKHMVGGYLAVVLNISIYHLWLQYIVHRQAITIDLGFPDLNFILQYPVHRILFNIFTIKKYIMPLLI